MKRILFFLLLLVNLQLTTDNGSLGIGLGKVSAQGMLEEMLEGVEVMGTAPSSKVECKYCFGSYEKDEIDSHESECPERTTTCDVCRMTYKASVGHTCIESRCCICGNPTSKCTCTGPIATGSYTNTNRPSGGGGGGGSSSSSNQYHKISVSKLENALKNAVKITKQKYGTGRACNVGVQEAFKYAFGYVPNELQGQANDIIKKLRTSKNWKKISRKEAAKCAAQGNFVIAGWYNNSSGGNGHLVVGHPNSEGNGRLHVMDCGPTGVGKNEDQGWRYSFGKTKRNDVEYFVYK